MKHLPLPPSAAKDDRLVTVACRRGVFTPHLAAWLATYANYRAAGSDPWTVIPHAFPDPVKIAQRGLYETRKSNGPIRTIRRARGLLCCPLCGSQAPSSVDHLLPKAVYPEFSVMRANLVPACAHCNSGSKGNKHRGPVAPARFIHPYFDAFANNPIWRIRINPPFPAATFDAVPEPGLTHDQTSIVVYHLENVLGEAFKERTRTTWSTYPGEVQVGADGGPLTDQTVEAAVRMDLRKSTISEGPNSWRSAFLRGVLADPAVIADVRARAIAYP